MSVNFEEVNKNSLRDFELIAKWDNQEEIKYYIRPNFNEGEIEDINGDDLYKSFIDSSGKYIYMIAVDGNKIGYVSVDTNFPFLYKKDVATIWISICIGEKEYRDQGIGVYAMQFIEMKSKELQKNRIELGVFEYNERARKFYEKMGYNEVGRIEDFVYYNGNWHNDIRMEKYI